MKKAWTALQSSGYSHNELQNNLDSRILLVAHELAVLREENIALKATQAAGKKAAETVKKTVPRFVLKGGKGASKSPDKTATLATSSARFGRAKKSGSLDDAVAAAMTLDMEQMET